MSKKEDRSVSVGSSSVVGSIQTGDHNFAVVNQTVQFPQPESVDIKKQLEILCESLEGLQVSADKTVVSEVEELKFQISKDEPDKQKVGSAVTKIAGYLKKSSLDLATKETLKACFIQIVGWLGSNFHNLVSILPQ